jgi:hypothetical protein
MFHAGFLLNLFHPEMEATCSSETSVDIQCTTLRYIPEDSTLHNDRRENLKFYKIMLIFHKIDCQPI